MRIDKKFIPSIIVVYALEGESQLASRNFNRSPRHTSNMKSLIGTFAVEDMTVSDKTRRNLDRLAQGTVSYQQLLDELRKEYERKGN